MSAATPRRILVADDEPALLELYTEQLEQAGYEVRTARNGRAALDLLQRESFDLVLSDIMMPDTNGVQLLRAVRQRDLDVPVVLVTGSPSVETAVEALELGALRYLVKPVIEEELLRTIEDAIRLHGLARLKREALAHLGSAPVLAADRAGLEAVFGRALSALWLAYQPVVRAGSGEIFGYEALLRTQEPSLPDPGAFLECAERLGRVWPLGRAIRDAAAHVEVAEGSALLVNLHPLDLTDDALYQPDAALSGRARSVVLEVTERARLDGVRDLRERVGNLRALGFRIAIDDFGAGYAGLSAFAALEPDLLKLDMSLVRGVDHEPIKRTLIGSIVKLCKELDVTVIAEGVETPAERDAVTDLGCDLLQGYLFGRPAPRNDGA